MSMAEKVAFWRNDPYEDLASSLARIRGDADALALLPYDDGTFWLKPANFDKELIGGQGGYETDDGDKIVLDGEGKPVRDFMGVNIVTALDPTEHAGAVDMVKAAVAHKHNLGEWIKVDRQGHLIDVGESLTQLDTEVLEPELMESQVGDRAKKLAKEKGGRAEQMLDRAMVELEREGELTKIYDLAPPASASVDSDGNLALDEATHIAVDQSKAADLMPTTTSTTELNTALDKARLEEYEEGKLMKYFVYGMASGAITAVLFGGIMVAINSFL